MPIIGKVGQKSFKVRFLNISIHTILLVGSITMIYPFLMMISASFKSEVDSTNFSLIPKFFYNDQVLYKKYIESRLNEQSNQLIERYKNRYIAFSHINSVPKADSLSYSILKEYIALSKNRYSLFDFAVSEQFARGVYPKNERLFREKVKSVTGSNLDDFNKTFSANAKIWKDVRMEEKDILARSFNGKYDGFQKFYLQFRDSLPIDERVYLSIDGNFLTNELLPFYQNNLKALNRELETDYPSFGDIVLSKTLPQGKISKHWISYVKKRLNFNHIGILSTGFKSYIKFLKDKYQNISLLNKTWGKEYENFDSIDPNEEKSDGSAQMEDYGFFIENISNPKDLYIKSFEIDYREYLKEKFNTLDSYYNSIHSGYSSFNEIDLDSNFPSYNVKKGDLWQEFVLSGKDRYSINILPISQTDYVKFLKDKKGYTLESLNSDYNKKYDSWLNIYPSKNRPKNSFERADWEEFLEVVNPKFLTINGKSHNKDYVNFLKGKYETIEDLNKDLGYKKSRFEDLKIDYLNYDYMLFKEHRDGIFSEMLARNYIMVLDVMLYNGRAIYNTIIYCLLAIFTALLVNPLAAYAMSRFKFRSNYKIILILMLTMAFPPMVMGIPNFLLLKNMNLLNTFWALILPAAADGYFIFLLKGFFDSLPKELFESATIDGASETRIFFQIAMALSKPIMAVIALGAFNGAYRNFMFAFLVCQDNSMWTMMVHIYQLIQKSSSGVGFAALVIASIPTFLVFVFFQNIIIKGIVVPTEK
ncbi:MAG: hypothetical protein CR982_10110 [Candidatus Cloacimonadota bacterium]|nr:MAG: hypothetical protein CR982_10110 [Candidatus Cloacimonadota bacterium]PIE77347.1 MAG: hypothetical protein CSA15_13400 [Candidatus Delongbacteria bacterium]